MGSAAEDGGRRRRRGIWCMERGQIEIDGGRTDAYARVSFGKNTKLGSKGAAMGDGRSAIGDFGDLEQDESGQEQSESELKKGVVPTRNRRRRHGGGEDEGD
ncbi:hypothetical protein B0H13DRAFT_1888666 [Mycena leptocephala]|nr:hypothetical protein B0H13DRAFT_1888666 [Mycena leptocephala]